MKKQNHSNYQNLYLPQDIKKAITILKEHITTERFNRFIEVLKNRIDQFRVVFQDIHHPHNIAAMLRTCEAFGIQNTHIISRERSHLTNNITRGAHNWLTINYDISAKTCLNSIKEKGFYIVYASPDADKKLDELNFDQKIAFIMGNELDGISKDVKEIADESFQIPMAGFVESLNVSVCLGIILQTAKTLQKKGLTHIDNNTQDILLYSWCARSINSYQDILNRHGL